MSYIPFHPERLRRSHTFAELAGLFLGALIITVASCCREPNVPGPSPAPDADTTTVVVEVSDAEADFHDFSDAGEDADIVDLTDAGPLATADAGALLEAGTPCDRMYAVLVKFRCEEAKTIRPPGERPETFVALCKRAIASGHPMPTACVARARTKTAVQRCGVLCDKPRTQ